MTAAEVAVTKVTGRSGHALWPPRNPDPFRGVPLLAGGSQKENVPMANEQNPSNPQQGGQNKPGQQQQGTQHKPGQQGSQGEHGGR